MNHDNGQDSPMTSGNLIPSDPEPTKMTPSEVQFALVISRMIDSVKNSPEDMRQAVYDLARYKLREQFTYADAKDIQCTERALEVAIQGVEEFSKQQQNRISAPVKPAEINSPDVSSPIPQAPTPALLPPNQVNRSQPRIVSAAQPTYHESKSASILWPRLLRTALLISLLIGSLVAFKNKDRLLSWSALPKLEWQTANRDPVKPAEALTTPAPAPIPAKPNPLRPTDYGVYAISDDSLTELQLLPGRAPDLRIAVSAAIKAPGQSVLPNGHPKFIVFRRQAAASVSDHPDVRVIAKVAREFSTDIAGKKPGEGDETWVIRNVAFPFRASPVADNPEMYELHSEDPTLELSPGRYALVVGIQSYDFSVAGEVVDPKQCIERIVSLNGTYYSDCKKP